MGPTTDEASTPTVYVINPLLASECNNASQSAKRTLPQSAAAENSALPPPEDEDLHAAKRAKLQAPIPTAAADGVVNAHAAQRAATICPMMGS
jgi:hypothetical protein